MSDTKHTPTPWYLYKTKDTISDSRGNRNAIYAVIGPEGDNVAVCKAVLAPNDANAEFIVRACNSHDALLEACKTAYEFVVKQSRSPLDEADCLSGKLIMAIQKASER